jgi:hypothetical protein
LEDRVVTPLEAIALDKLKIIDSWRNAPSGTILQVTGEGDVPFIGMYSVAEGRFGEPQSYILVLHGDRRGALLDGKELLGPALDVTELVDIRVSHPQPNSFQLQHHMDGNFVCELGTTGSGRFFLRNGELDIPRYVCLLDMTHKIPVGGIITGVLDTRILVIGQIEVVAKEAAVRG